MELKALSPAKINLFLKVIGKRQDGMHLLQSYFAKLSLADTISVKGAAHLECKFTNIAQVEDNLALKAAYILKEKCKYPGGAKIKITKNIPIGGGLGGGSSNAATTMTLLNKLWSLNLSMGKLKEMAVSIGADVPFFLSEVNGALVEGIGEKISPQPLNQTYHIVLCNPSIESSTALVYRSYNHNNLSTLSAEENIKSCINDLKDSAITLYPEIGHCLDVLQAQQGCTKAQISGTGATCFGLFKTKEEALSASRIIRNQKPNWWAHYETLAL